MPNITHNIKLVQQRIADCARGAGRSADAVTLLAVSKGQSVDRIREAAGAGLTRFGENYLQEALEKIDALENPGLEWHFIGPLQSNKTRAVAENFQWLHTVDRIKIAERLSRQRPGSMSPLNLCIQVNIDGEKSKSGVAPREADELATAIAGLPGLRLRGLMAIPTPGNPAVSPREPFFRLARLLDRLRALSPELAHLDTLSMGMSGDMEAAIAEGATIVRVGTAIFGPRGR
jgi:hypothetical protein